MQLEGFQKKYRAAKRQAVTQAVARLQQATTQAVDTLEAIMGDKDAPAGSRVTAAKTVLEMAVKAVELDDLAARIEALERVVLDERGTA